MMFTDLIAAIEEARYLKSKFKFDYSVVQKSSGLMKVETNYRAELYPQIGVMFSTKNDAKHTVLPEVR